MRQFDSISFWSMLLQITGLLFSSTATFAQQETIAIGERFTVHSGILKENRAVQVFLPGDYLATSDSCHVAFVLDGEWNFSYASTLVDKLVSAGDMPKTIVVGIENIVRSRDLTPAGTNDNLQRFGGAQKFLDFIVKELKPWLGAKYRIHDHNVLLGHSFGGLFSVYSMMEIPSAFQGIVALSPSLGRNDEQQVRRAEEYLTRGDIDGQQSLYLAVGNEGGLTLSSTKKLVFCLDRLKPDFLDYHFDHLAKESHESIVIRGFQRGLQYIYRGFNPTKKPELDDLFQIEQHYAQLSERFGHTIAVPEPFFQEFAAEQIGLRDLDYAFFLLGKYKQAYPNSLHLTRLYGDAYLLNGEYVKAAEYYSQLVDRGISEPSLSRILDGIKKMK